MYKAISGFEPRACDFTSQFLCHCNEAAKPLNNAVLLFPTLISEGKSVVSPRKLKMLFMLKNSNMLFFPETVAVFLSRFDYC